MFAAALLLSASAAAAPACTSVDKGNAAALATRANDIRNDDGIYKFLVKANGSPGLCKGSIVTAAAQVDGWVEFTWPDRSVLQTQFMAPEIFKLRYSRAAGLRQPSELLAAFREYAAGRGISINWDVPHKEAQGDGEVVEYRDNDPGMNGVVRLTYDKDRRFVSISLSIAP